MKYTWHKIYFRYITKWFFFSFWVCFMACGPWFPNQGSSPHPSHWKCTVLTSGPPRSPNKVIWYSLVFSDSSVHRRCALIMIFTAQWAFEYTFVSCRSVYKQYYTTRAEEGNANPLQCSYLENSMDRGTWWTIVRRVAKSWAQLSTHAYVHTTCAVG